jgi:hypothetical protein
MDVMFLLIYLAGFCVLMLYWLRSKRCTQCGGELREKVLDDYARTGTFYHSEYCPRCSFRREWEVRP